MSLPVVAPAAMRRFDEAAGAPVEVLIERAAWHVAGAARRLLGGTYGRRIVILAGPGNNGADGRTAARLLDRSGARCRVLDARALPDRLPAADLVIDAAFGTGFRSAFAGPDPGGVPVLAVDLPSGVDGLTGEIRGRPIPAAETVTFAAHKPGLLLWPGCGLAGRITVADVGIGADSPDRLITDDDVRALWPRRDRQAHKWQSATWVIGGSSEGGQAMSGALTLAATGALRSGSSYVRTSIPGDPGATSVLAESVGHAIGLRQGADSSDGWGAEVLQDQDRFGCLVVGPGLAVSDVNRRAVAEIVAGWPRPLVLDAGALDGLGDQRELLRHRRVPAVLTPHDGEFTRLGGRHGSDRVASVRDLADDLGAVVLSKGPTTLVAEPGGGVRYVTTGDQRLATAGSGDVLAGLIGTALTLGLSPATGAALAAHAHGRAASLGPPVGLAAGDLGHLVSRWLSLVVGAGQ